MKQGMNNFKKLWDNAPSPICVREGPEHRYAYANKAYKQLVGKQDFLNQPFKKVLPELVNQGLQEILDRVYDTGETYQAEELSVVLIKDNTPQRFYVNIIYQPLTDDEENVFGILVQIIDITKQVELRKEKEVLLQELHHRVGNNLAIITGIIDMQASEITNDDCSLNFRNTRKRIGTFTNVHELIFRQSDLKNIPVYALFEKISNQCIEYDNPEFTISVMVDNFTLNINQAIPLGLICNEILTWFKNRMNNIQEVGIESELSNQGEVEIVFTLRSDGSSDKKHILWDNNSFEGRLINIFAKQLRAKVEVNDSDEYVIVHVTFAKTDISGSGAYKFL
ncbi:MAG: histidine kinase dimerization/phosphoacceptor domain -containing protein [Balneolales bacterium]